MITVAFYKTGKRIRVRIPWTKKEDKILVKNYPKYISREISHSSLRRLLSKRTMSAMSTRYHDFKSGYRKI